MNDAARSAALTRISCADEAASARLDLESRIIAASESMQAVLHRTHDAARSSSPVLITGPKGVGRAHLARTIHRWSPRVAAPLTLVEPGEIAEIEAADEALRERVRATEGGTLVVRDLQDQPDGVRAWCARALDATKIDPVAPVRLIVTAHESTHPLRADSPTLEIRIAALSERPEDLIPLANHFLALRDAEAGTTPVRLTSDARHWIQQQTWSENVRELRARLLNAADLAVGNAITAESLMLSAEEESLPSFREAKRAFEARYVAGLLNRCGGNVTRAARIARKDRKDFYDVIRRAGINPDDFRHSRSEARGKTSSSGSSAPSPGP